MKFKFTPQRSDSSLSLSVSGDILTINGVPFDFSSITDPEPAFGSDFLVGFVERDNGEISVSVAVPHSAVKYAELSFTSGRVERGDVTLPTIVSAGWEPSVDGGPVVVLPRSVDTERDRRIEAGFSYAGHTFQARAEDKTRISGAALLAVIAMQAGAQPGNLRWHGGASDFVWIAADNSLVAMDAPTVIGLGKAAAEHETAHVFAGKALKGMNPIPLDFAGDKYWP